VQIGDGGDSISIDDGGNTITVDGTVAATQSGTWNITNVSGTVSLPTGASTAANQTTQTTHLSNIATSLAILDDFDETDRCKVNIIVGQAGAAGGAGAVGATVQRVTLASDDPAVASLSVMDDWDETNRAAVNIIAGQVGVAAGAGAVSALTQRVVHSLDTTVPTQIIKTVAATGTPEVLAADGTFFTSATIIAKKAARTANTGTVYLGLSSTNDAQPRPLEPGEEVVIKAPTNQKYDLNDLYLDVTTNGDGVVIWYS
jgi:hypothetical protein